MINRNSGIYKILNKINGKFYIGSATDFYERWHSHKHYLNNSNHHNSHLQRAWDKYWSTSFEFIILEECEKEKLEEREQHWINTTNCCNKEIGYNINFIANNASGVKRSPETKAKMSAWQIGRVLTDAHKEKISIAHVGKSLSTEAKLKLRKLNKWPCEKGSKCNCHVCRNKRYRLRDEWRANKNKTPQQIRSGAFLFRG